MVSYKPFNILMSRGASDLLGPQNRPCQDSSVALCYLLQVLHFILFFLSCDTFQISCYTCIGYSYNKLSGVQSIQYSEAIDGVGATCISIEYKHKHRRNLELLGESKGLVSLYNSCVCILNLHRPHKIGVTGINVTNV